jgi:hypothetical protein
MKRYPLFAVDALDKPVKLSSQAIRFTNESRYFGITVSLEGTTIGGPTVEVVKVVTPKGVHELKKHATQNYFHGTLNGHKVQVSLKKVVGELRYW